MTLATKRDIPGESVDGYAREYVCLRTPSRRHRQATWISRLVYSFYPQPRTLRLRVIRNPGASEQRRAGTWPNRRAISRLLRSSARSMGEIEHEVLPRSDSGFP
jgi:hypothetical protein